MSSNMIRILTIIIAIGGSTLCYAEIENVNKNDRMKYLEETVNALVKHRQEDYNALELSLKRAIEKNTELMAIKDEVKLLRKEVNLLRGGSGNEVKNEKLRVRWLGSAVTELKSELAQVLRTRNASEELAERSRMRNELLLLRGDVAEVGKGVRDLDGRITQIEGALTTIRVDIAAGKGRASQLSQTCADVASQLSTMQIELKSLMHNEAPSSNHHQHYNRHSKFPIIHHLEDRLTNLERKISLVSRKRSTIEKQIIYETETHVTTRLKILEQTTMELSEKLMNLTNEFVSKSKITVSIIQCFELIESLQDKTDTYQSELKQQLTRLDINSVKRRAEISLTREELSNLRRTVQALSVSASKLQEKSDRQEDTIIGINNTLNNFNMNESFDKIRNVTHQLETGEDEYHKMISSLTSNCEEREGLSLLTVGPGLPLSVWCRKGWIVISRRIDGIVDFDRSWNEYALGFGSPVNEFWIGNEALHTLTRDNCTRLRIDLVDIDGVKWRADYEYFNIDSEDNGYRMRIDGFTGNSSDAMSYQNDMKFSTKDRDLDITLANCAANYHGGWWFSHCQHANLNGKYSLGLSWFRSDRNEWIAVASAEMSIQKKHRC